MTPAESDQLDRIGDLVDRIAVLVERLVEHRKAEHRNAQRKATPEC